MIDEGTPFCPQCGAPQIRVVVPESDAPSFAPGTPAEMQPPAEPVPLTMIPVPAEGVSWRHAIRPIILGGLIILFGSTLGSMVQLGILWNLLIIALGTIIAVALYARSHARIGRELSASIGAKIGAAAALSSIAVLTLVLIIGIVFYGPLLRQSVIDNFQQMRTQLTDPQSRELIENMMDKVKTPEGFAAFITVALAFSFVFFGVFGAAGGAIGATLMNRHQRR